MGLEVKHSTKIDYFHIKQLTAMAMPWASTQTFFMQTQLNVHECILAGLKTTFVFLSVSQFDSPPSKLQFPSGMWLAFIEWPFAASVDPSFF
jgi:hypothetical protein